MVSNATMASTMGALSALLAILAFVLGGLLNFLYDVIAACRPRKPGKEFLSGNYAPVATQVRTCDLEVEGRIPDGLEGAYIRTGPNPAFKPVGGYHWFDGDGMVHGVRLSQGKAASYSNHYVRTTKYLAERQRGKALYRKGGDIFGWLGLVLLLVDSLRKRLKIIDVSKGTGTANTALVYHAQRILALHEGDLPYQLRILCSGVIETLGRLTVKGEGLPAFPSQFTAHPKIDPVTGEMFFFGYVVDSRPYVRAGIMDAKGSVLKQWAIHTPYPAMMHDCGLTKNYGVLLHMPLVFDPKGIAKGGFPFQFRPELGTRVGLLHRDNPGTEGDLTSVDTPSAPVQWFDLPPGYVFHVANSWEDEEGRVHVVTCHFEEFNFHGLNEEPASLPPESEKQQLTEYVLDPATGKTVSVTTLSPLKGVDFPVVHPNKTAHPNRYVWCATFEPNPVTSDADGIAKFDLSRAASGADTCVAEIRFPSGCYGGEAYFVPNTSASLAPAGDAEGDTAEDDGWLLVYVHDNTSQQSSLNIYDARTMDPTPLARVIMPQRVPYGFHGTFVTKDQLDAQKETLA